MLVARSVVDCVRDFASGGTWEISPNIPICGGCFEPDVHDLFLAQVQDTFIPKHNTVVSVETHEGLDSG